MVEGLNPNVSGQSQSSWNVSTASKGASQTEKTEAPNTNGWSSPWDSGDTIVAHTLKELTKSLNISRPFLEKPNDGEQQVKSSAKPTTSGHESKSAEHAAASTSNTTQSAGAQDTSAPETPTDSQVNRHAQNDGEGSGGSGSNSGGSGSGGSQASMDEQYKQGLTDLIKTTLQGQGGSGTEVEAQLKLAQFYIDNPDAPVPDGDKALVAIILSAQTQVSANIKASNPGVQWNPPQGQAEFNLDYDNSLNTALGTLQQTSSPPLTNAQLGQLKFAMYHPDLISGSDASNPNITSLKALVAINMSSAGYTIPASFTPDSESFDNAISADMNKNFELTLASRSNPLLTVVQQKELRTMYYNPELTVKDQATLAPILSQIKQEAVTSTRSSSNVPSSVNATWAPEVPTSQAANYTQTLQLNYQYNVEVNIQLAVAAASPPLTSAEQTQLRDFLGDPTLSNVPSKITTMANSILNAAKAQTINDFNLVEGTWTPVVGQALWSGNAPTFNMLTYSNQLQTSLNNAIANIGTGAKSERVKACLLDLLGIISSALSDLQSSIYSCESQNAALQSKQSLSQKDAMDGQVIIRGKQLDDMMAQQKEMADKQEKAGQVKSIMQIVGPIVTGLMIIATALVTYYSLGTMTAPMIAATIAVTAVMTAIQIHDMVDDKHSWLGGMMTGISKGLKDAGCNDLAADILGPIIGTLCIIIFAVAAPGALASAGGGAAEGASAGASAGADAAAKAVAEEAAKEAAEIAAKTAADAAEAAAKATTQATASSAAETGTSAASDSATVSIDTVADDAVDTAADTVADAADNAADATDNTPQSVSDGAPQVEIDASAGDEASIIARNSEKSAAKAAHDKMVDATLELQEEVSKTATEAASEAANKAATEAGKTTKQAIGSLGRNIRLAASLAKVLASAVPVASGTTFDSKGVHFNKPLESQIADIKAEMSTLTAAANASDTTFDDQISAGDKFIGKTLEIMKAMVNWNESVSKSQDKLWQSLKINFEA